MPHEPPSTTAVDSVVLLGAEWFGSRPGGLNRYLLDLGGALRADGSRAEAVVVGPAAGSPSWVTAAGSVSDALPLRLWRFNRRAGRTGEPNGVVDAHFALYAAWPVITGGLRSRPLVVHFQGPWAEESRLAGPASSRPALKAKRVLERAVYRRARRVVVLSQPFKRILVERYGVAPWDVDVIAPGVDLQRFEPGDPVMARERVGLARHRPTVVTVRRLERRMGLETLLEAWAEVCRDHDDALLAIVGEGSIRQELDERVVDLGITGNVRFLGRLGDEDLADWYRAVDVSVVPSTALEGFGLVVLESLACGTPVLVSDTGGLPAAVDGLGPGLVVPAGDPRAWAARLGECLTGRLRLPDAGSCRSHAEGFSWKHVAGANRVVYDAARHPTRRLRVVFVDHCSELAGAELALVELASSLRDRVDVHVLVGSDGPLVRRLLRCGVSVEVLPMAESARSMRRARARFTKVPLRAVTAASTYAVRLALRLRQLQPDLVHTNSLKAAYYGGLAGRMAGIPVVWHVHDQITTEHLPGPIVRLTRWLGRRVPAALVANSTSTLKTLGPLGQPAAVVPGVIVDPSAWAPLPRRGDRPFRVGMVGRLAHWKGQHVFVSAFARAFPDGEARAVVVGGALFSDDEYELSLKALTHRLGLDGRVDFLGQVDDVASELARLDVMVHASVAAEPFGRVIVEAMAAGVPVVASRAGGAEELVEHEVTGVLVAPGDVEELADALVRLERSPDLGARLAEAALGGVGRFSADGAVELVMDLYDRALQHPRIFS